MYGKILIPLDGSKTAESFALRPFFAQSVVIGQRR
jgi:hypothetical protein